MTVTTQYEKNKKKEDSFEDEMLKFDWQSNSMSCHHINKH